MNSGTFYYHLVTSQPFGRGWYLKNYGMCWKKKIHWVWLLVT